MAVVLALAAMNAPAGSVRGGAAAPASSTDPQAMQLDLTKPFHTRSAWRLTVGEGMPTKDYGDNDAPGALTLCLRKGPTGPCQSGPVAVPLRAVSPADPIAWEPHYLKAARVVYQKQPNGTPLLLIVTASLSSGDGDQVLATQLIAYDAARDVFQRVYAQDTGRNNNQEIRFVTKGPLTGSVIVAEPQAHSPYGYWIVVKQLRTGVYRQALRYPSATLYNDGNPLPVIDSEMPTIERRLGVWHPGAPLPTPATTGGGAPCLRPTLKHGELWCG